MSDRNWRHEDDREMVDYDNYGGGRPYGGQDWRRNEDRTEGDWKRRRINDDNVSTCLRAVFNLSNRVVLLVSEPAESRT